MVHVAKEMERIQVIVNTNESGYAIESETKMDIKKSNRQKKLKLTKWLACMSFFNVMASGGLYSSIDITITALLLFRIPLSVKISFYK